MAFNNCPTYSPLISNVKLIEKVIAGTRGGSISNWFDSPASNQPSYEPIFSVRKEPAFNLFCSPDVPNDRDNAPIFDFNEGFDAFARRSDLDGIRSSFYRDDDIHSRVMARVQDSFDVNFEKSFSPPSTEINKADSSDAISLFNAPPLEWSSFEKPNCDEPDSSSEIINGGGRPLLGRNAEYYATFGTNIFPESAELPSFFAYSLDRRTSRYYAPKPKVRVLKKECVFCKRLGKPNFDTHWLKTSQNVVTCPELRKYKCKICGCQGGDDAHTIRFCPLIRTRLGEQYQCVKNQRRV